MCDDYLSICFIFTFDVLDIPFDNGRKYLRREHCLACFWSSWSECGQPPQHPNMIFTLPVIKLLCAMSPNREIGTLMIPKDFRARCLT